MLVESAFRQVGAILLRMQCLMKHLHPVGLFRVHADPFLLAAKFTDNSQYVFHARCKQDF